MRPVALDQTTAYRALWAHATPRMERMVFDGHARGVKSLDSFEIDGRQILASAGSDYLVRLWNAESAEELAALSGHRDRVNCVRSFRLGSQTLLASGGSDKLIYLWDPASRIAVRTLSGHTGWVTDICPFAMHDGIFLASSGGAEDMSIIIWSPGTGETLHRLRGHRDRINSVCSFEIDGRTLLASGSDDRRVIVWDPESGEQVRVLGNHGAWVNSVCAFSADGQIVVAAGDDDGFVTLWNPETGQVTPMADPAVGSVSCIRRIEHQGRVLIAWAGRDNEMIAVTDAEGRYYAGFRGHVGGVNDVCAVNIEGNTILVSAGKDGTIREWELSDAAAATEQSADPVGEMWTFSEGERELLGCITNKFLGGSVFDLNDGNLVENFDVTSDQFSDFNTLRTSGWPGIEEADIFEFINPRLYLPELYDVTAMTGSVTAENTYIAAAEGDGAVVISRINLREDRLREYGSRGPVDRLFTVQGVAEEMCWAEYPAEYFRNRLYIVISVGNGGLISVGTAFIDRDSVGILGEGQWELFNLTGHTGRVNSLCSMPETRGRHILASASDDRTVRIWDLSERVCLATIPVHHPALVCKWRSGVLAVGLTVGLVGIRFDLSKLRI
jgi:WD40 repeat protein